MNDRLLLAQISHQRRMCVNPLLTFVIQSNMLPEKYCSMNRVARDLIYATSTIDANVLIFPAIS